MSVFLTVTVCILVEVYRRYRGAYDRPDDGDSIHMCNVDKLHDETSHKTHDAVGIWNFANK